MSIETKIVNNFNEFTAIVRNLNQINPNHTILKVNFRLAPEILIFKCYTSQKKYVYLSTKACELQQYIQLQNEINSSLSVYLEKLSHL